MHIHLNELNLDGESFHFNQNDREMTLALNDLLKGQNYELDIQVLPIGEAYDLNGRIKTKMPLTCSFCAEDFLFDIDKSFREVVMPSKRPNTPIKGQHLEEAEFEEIDSLDYDLSEFAHAALVLMEPLQPECKTGCKGLCHQCGTNLNTSSCCCTEQKNESNNAFSVLKNIKLN